MQGNSFYFKIRLKFNIIENFLTDRKIITWVGVTYSEEHTLENGTPQGSVLSPYLFNLMINDLDTNLASPKIGLSQFADDSGLWRTGNPSNHQDMAEL